jgi:hypothetical protein
MIAATVSALSISGCSADESDTDTGDVGGNGNGDADTDTDTDTDTGGNGNGDADTDTDTDTDTGGNGNGDQPDFEILEHTFFQEQYSEGVRGTARNNTDSEFGYAEVEVVFLDDSGTQIGDGLDNVTDLAADRSWEFECLFLGDDASRIDSYEIEASTGF